MLIIQKIFIGFKNSKYIIVSSSIKYYFTFSVYISKLKIIIFGIMNLPLWRKKFIFMSFFCIIFIHVYKIAEKLKNDGKSLPDQIFKLVYTQRTNEKFVSRKIIRRTINKYHCKATCFFNTLKCKINVFCKD